ncbi:MAG: KilA-N domain-containing protein, partial [Clostridia bacterium]|nr:KilA-N domain-containing protein [Clostridia bacterium]
IGSFAHPDIAFEFASWLSPEFKLYVITEFERLKTTEAYQNKTEWSVKRELSKTNYIIHTDSIKECIIPTLTEKQKQYVYANEADVLNVALFGMTAKEWRDQNPNLDGNIRDYTDILHLVVLANLENLNAELITSGISQSERIVKLNNTAKKQLELLKNNSSVRRLEKMDEHLKLE